MHTQTRISPPPCRGTVILIARIQRVHAELHANGEIRLLGREMDKGREGVQGEERSLKETGVERR